MHLVGYIMELEYHELLERRESVAELLSSQNNRYSIRTGGCCCFVSLLRCKFLLQSIRGGRCDAVSQPYALWEELVQKCGRLLVIEMDSFGAQSFTSLKADHCQDINRGLAFNRCLNGTFLCRKWSGKALVSWLRREDLYLLLCSFGLMHQCLIPSSTCSIKAPAKWRNSVYVLTGICLQWSKWLGP